MARVDSVLPDSRLGVSELVSAHFDIATDFFFLRFIHLRKNDPKASGPLLRFAPIEIPSDDCLNGRGIFDFLNFKGEFRS